MARAATSRLKVNPVLGSLPVLQFIPPKQLDIDPAYQRSIETGASKSLIRKIAQFWNWDLCQPLVVSRREDGKLYVIDGQHRWEAAKLRGDIDQIPCVVVSYQNAADEAASFVQLNQQRRPLQKLEIFAAAVASEDPESIEIREAIEGAGLTLAKHSNYTAWKPKTVANIGGIQNSWRTNGPVSTKSALYVMANAWPDQVLRYGGTVFPGIAAVCDIESGFIDSDGLRDEFVELVSSAAQTDWRAEIAKARVEDPNLKYKSASIQVFSKAWKQKGIGFFSPDPLQLPPKPSGGVSRNFKPDMEGMCWCDQCDRRIDKEAASTCNSPFCSLRAAKSA